MITLCLIALAGCFVLSLCLGAMLRRIAHRCRLVDDPTAVDHKAHGQSVPNVGGVGIVLTIIAAMAGLMIGAAVLPTDTIESIAPGAGRHVAGLVDVMPYALALLVCIVVLHVVGVIDDRMQLGPYVKLLVQVVVAVIIAGPIGMRVLQVLDQFGPLGIAASIAITVAWLIVITNAMNFLDNMDGLAAGVGVIIAGLYLAATLIAGQWFVAGLCAIVAGSYLGFLPHNFPRARMYMGDGGSLVLGLALGVIAVQTSYVPWEAAGQPGGEGVAATIAGEGGPMYALLVPVMIMAIPLYDCVSVTLMRLRAGQSPMRGDRNHFSHRLVRTGLSSTAAVVVIYACTLATGLSGVMLASLAPWQAALAAVQTASVVVVLAMLEFGKR